MSLNNSIGVTITHSIFAISGIVSEQDPKPCPPLSDIGERYLSIFPQSPLAIGASLSEVDSMFHKIKGNEHSVGGLGHLPSEFMAPFCV